MKKLTNLLSLIGMLAYIVLFNSCNKNESLPVLITVKVSDVTLTTAKSGGYISNDGGADVTARGIAWSKSKKPTIDDNITKNGTGTGNFVSELTGLTPGTTYYIRAYATNSEGTAYGNQETFATSIEVPTLTTAAAADITITTAMSGGNITNNGGDSITARGICWSTTENPTITGSKTSDGTGSGSFISHLTDLSAATTYYVRAFATNSAGTAYGNQIFFTTSQVVVPTLTTAGVTGITASTAISGGTVTSDGGGVVTARGICWSITEIPTIANFITSNMTGTGSFVSNLTGLSAGTTYYVRSYATNSAGTAYGNTLNFRTTPVLVPTVTTATVSDITATTAISGGNVTADGGNPVTAKGICWNTTGNPTTANQSTTNGTGTGSFLSDLSGLSPGTTYFVRAYATNNIGTSYGNQVTFTTAVTMPVLQTAIISEITFNSARSGGSISSNGGASITVKGICWSTTEDPTTANSKTENGTGVGSFVSNLTGLLPATTYYVRAYATNSAGTAYGNQVSFITSPAPAILTTAVAADITSNSAISGGNITNDGGSDISVRGVCWSTTENPTTAGSKTENGQGTGSFTSNLAGLSPGTTYYIRAYAVSTAGTAYGNQVSFTTLAALPSLTTAATTGITYTTATSGGTISDDGGGAITLRGVCWNILVNPTTANNKTENGTGEGGYVSNLTGLLPGTTYFVRAYATNSAGTAYGNQVSFTTTAAGMPIINTIAITSLVSTAAISGGSITDEGGAAVTARGVCWSTTTAPTTANSTTSNGAGLGTFVSNLTGLTAGTTYYVRAYATNSAGTAYGNEVTFITPVTDIEGNIYKTVVIGTQVWMAENLKTTKFNDNADITYVPGQTEWVGQTGPAFCWFNNLTANKDIYGALYNWFTLNTGKLCPAGWHAPTDSEFNTMELSLGLSPESVDIWGWRGTDQGLKMKSTTGWESAGNGTNTSGLTVLPGGYRQHTTGDFWGNGSMTYFWTSSDDAANSNPTVSWYRRLDYNKNSVYKATTLKTGGKYVRCVKD